MVKTIDMQDMRYLNLFERITRIRTRYCFKYNEALVFCVPEKLVSKAIGEKGKNVKKLQEILNKKIKVVPLPNGIKDAEVFIQSIINPVGFRELGVGENEIVISAGKNKAALIGRNKRRLLEMQKITKGFFDREFRVV